MAEKTGLKLESLLTETNYDNSKHDRLVKYNELRLNLSNKNNIYDTVLHNANYFYPNVNGVPCSQVSDADNIAISHSLKKIIYIEDKSSTNKGLVKKGRFQLHRAKAYFNKHCPEYQFYGFLCRADVKNSNKSSYKHKNYSMKRIV